MVRPIIHDPIFLQRPSEKAMKEDVEVARDLADTLRAHIDHCAGLAANMIGVNKCILAVADGKDIIVMLNPELMKHSLKACSRQITVSERYAKVVLAVLETVRFGKSAFASSFGSAFCLSKTSSNSPNALFFARF